MRYHTLLYYKFLKLSYVEIIEFEELCLIPTLYSFVVAWRGLENPRTLDKRLLVFLF